MSLSREQFCLKFSIFHAQILLHSKHKIQHCRAVDYLPTKHLQNKTRLHGETEQINTIQQ